jgi:cytosine deaminase
VVLPRFVDAHVHLDKAFTWHDHPNLDGTYEGALNANLVEHQSRSVEVVMSRGERALQQAFTQGLRAVRSHIDSGGPGAASSWEALERLQLRWQGRVELQLVALAPLAFWSSAEAESMARRLAMCNGLLGGVLEPSMLGPAVDQQLKALLRLADRHGLAVDLHIDEADHAPAQGVKQLLRALQITPVAVPISCSHASSLSLLPQAALQRLGERMMLAKLQVIALPLTNAWLLERRSNLTPLQRPQAPIRQLQRSGVRVAVAGDNVADPWFPGGDFDPLSLMAAAIPLTQLLPWQRLGLAPFTTAAAAVLGLSWDGVLRRGAPADLLAVKGTSWSDVLRGSSSRRVLVQGQWLSSTFATT